MLDYGHLRLVEKLKSNGHRIDKVSRLALPCARYACTTESASGKFCSCTYACLTDHPLPPRLPFWLRVFPGAAAFQLYSSMGFPLDLLTLMAEEKVTLGIVDFTLGGIVHSVSHSDGYKRIISKCDHGCTSVSGVKDLLE